MLAQKMCVQQRRNRFRRLRDQCRLLRDRRARKLSPVTSFEDPAQAQQEFTRRRRAARYGAVLEVASTYRQDTRFAVIETVAGDVEARQQVERDLVRRPQPLQFAAGSMQFNQSQS